MIGNGEFSAEELFLFDTRMNDSKLINAMDMDMIFYNKNKKKYLFIELLRTGNAQERVTPWTSHPNKYFYSKTDGSMGNRLKFILQKRFANAAGADYQCINYAKIGDNNDQLIRVMNMEDITEELNKINPVKSRNYNMSREKFKLSFKDFLNKNCIKV